MASASPVRVPLDHLLAEAAEADDFPGSLDRQTLFIMATTQLLGVELAIPGLPY
jgi:hypothetical protein